MSRFVGLDFGTTNSSLAVQSESGEVAVARFRSGDSTTESFRSVLYFAPPERGPGRRRSHVFAGPSAIAEYLNAEENRGRLIQSIKSFAASRHFTATTIFGQAYTFEQLVTLLVKRIVAEAEEQFGPLGDTITVGRPVKYANADTEEDEAFAVGRIRQALEMAGFRHIAFEYEPVGAAYFYDRQLDHDELVLIADFGGGTSDFSLLRVGPSTRSLGARRILGNSGVAIAGDTFDGSIIRQLVAPHLGMGGMLRSHGKMLPVPTWVYLRLERWHHLSFLRDPETLQMLRSVRAQAQEPKRIEALLSLIELDLGYYLHKAVQETKVALSERGDSPFDFHTGSMAIRALVERASFEKWIQAEVSRISACVDGLLRDCGVDGRDVDRVFLTGGSSFVPTVRRVFIERFGADKVTGGSEFTSVAKGLAMRASEC